MAYDLARRKIDDAESMLTVSLTEKLADLGYIWRIDMGYKSLGANGNYASIHFHTPVTHRVFYTFAQADKSGSELVISLIQGGTFAGGTAFTPYNYNEDDPIESACPLTDVKVGLSTDATPTTITGGTESYVSLVPGTAGGNQKPGGDARRQGIIVLKRDTDYTVKMLAKGALTFAAHVAMGIYPIRNAEE